MAQDYAEPSFDFEPPEASSPQEVKPLWRSTLSWFCYGCLIGVILFGIYFWWGQSNSSEPKPSFAKSTTSSSLSGNASIMTSPTSTTATSSTSSSRRGSPLFARSQAGAVPTFDFYTILPEQNGMSVVSDAVTDTSSSFPAVPSNIPIELKPTSSNDEPAPTTVLPESDSNAIKTAKVAKTAPAKSYSDSKATNKTYSAQVASFRLHRDADELRAKLLLNGFAATIQNTTDVHEDSWYRVTIGHYGERQEAQKICIKIQSLGYDCMVMSRATA